MTDSEVDDLRENDPGVAAAGESAVCFGLEEPVERADGELVEPEVADGGQDHPADDVAVDLDGLGCVFLALLDLRDPDNSDRLEVALPVEVALGLGGEVGGDLLLQSIHGSGCRLGAGRHPAIAASEFAKPGPRDVPVLAAPHGDHAVRPQRLDRPNHGASPRSRRGRRTRGSEGSGRASPLGGRHRRRASRRALRRGCPGSQTVRGRSAAVRARSGLVWWSCNTGVHGFPRELSLKNMWHRRMSLKCR